MGQGAGGAGAGSPSRADRAGLAAGRPAVLTREPFRVVCFGSSSTEGSGATTIERSYPSRLAHLFALRQPDLSAEVLNRGVGGDDILDMMARLDRDVLASKPALVIWQVGSNDPLRGVAIDAFRAALAQGTAAIETAGGELMLMEPQWSPALDDADRNHAFVDAVRAFGDTHGLFVIRRFDLMRMWAATGRATPEQMIGPDGLHMTDLGYRLLAESVYESVTRHCAAFAARVDHVSRMTGAQVERGPA